MDISDFSSSSSLFEDSNQIEKIKKKRKTLKLKKRINSTSIETDEDYNGNISTSNRKLK